MGTFAGFIGSAYTMQARPADAEDLINWYLERSGSPNSKDPNSLLPTPGLSLFCTLPQSPGRGILTINGRTFVVAGIGAYELQSNGTFTFLGSMLQDAYPATISTNGPAGHQVFFTSGGHGYIFDTISSVFTDVLSTANFGGFIDGYFVALDTNTATLQWSALEDGTSWSGADVAQRDTTGDQWISMLVTHDEIWLFGSQRSDVWRNVGTGNQTFVPIAFIEQGIMSPFARWTIDNAPHWWGASEDGFGVCFRANQYQPVAVSKPAIEYAVQGYSTVSDAVTWGYQEDGHAHLVTNFPMGGISWVLDSSTGEWHKRGSWDAPAEDYDAGRPQYHAYAFGKHLVMDRVSGAIYEQSTRIYTDFDDGSPIRRLRRSPYLAKEQKRIVFDQFQVDFEVGLGLQNGQGSDPQAMLRWSNNQAQTWSSEHWTTIGRIGAYGTRAVWNQLGQARNRVFECVVAEPMPARMTGAYVNARLGAS